MMRVSSTFRLVSQFHHPNGNALLDTTDNPPKNQAPKMTSVSRSTSKSSESFLPWAILAATTTAAVMVRHRVQRRRQEDAKIDSEAREHQYDEEISELSHPCPEDQDLFMTKEEMTVDLLPSMFPQEETARKVDNHSNDGTEETCPSFRSETFEV